MQPRAGNTSTTHKPPCQPASITGHEYLFRIELQRGGYRDLSVIAICHREAWHRIGLEASRIIKAEGLGIIAIRMQ